MTWHQVVANLLLPPLRKRSPHELGGSLSSVAKLSDRSSSALGISLSFSLGMSLAMLSAGIAPATAQTTDTDLPPTARYAQGEDVGLEEIVAEWRGYYADIPVYLCICQDDICDQSGQWPYREYDLYQLSVALGPSNGRFAEGSGANCFDIADGSRPSNPRAFSAALTSDSDPQAAAPPTPTPSEDAPIAPPPPGESPSESPQSPEAPAADAPESAPENAPENDAGSNENPAANIPTATTIRNGEAIRLDWPSGASNVVAVSDGNWTIDIANAFDCESFSLVDEKNMSAQRVVGEPVVDAATGNVAVAVLLDFCVEVDQSAVFVIDPNEAGGYALYRTQLPGRSDVAAVPVRRLTNEFSSYPFSSIVDMRYWDGSLLVQQGSASGAEAIVIFRPGLTPAGEYAGCGVVRTQEGADFLCPD